MDWLPGDQKEFAVPLLIVQALQEMSPSGVVCRSIPATFYCQEVQDKQVHHRHGQPLPLVFQVQRVC